MEILLKYGVGILGVLIGAYLAPWIENRKDTARVRIMVENVYLELDDFINESSYYISKTYEGYQKIYVSCHAKLATVNDISPVEIVRPIEFYVLEKHYVEIFPKVSSQERKALKYILVSVQFINQKINMLRQRHGIETNENPGDYLGLLKSICILKNTARILKDKKDKFSCKNESDDEIYQKIMKNLGLSDEPEHLITDWHKKKAAEQAVQKGEG
ncbi:hypothetical protein [Marinobacter sp. SS13-12]|uniref:hypothetical protein n=1 Tax=Marinobacter sp. SS13-12 TaxID=3050451 RepID=UPI002556BBFD|nr:hypothetical protein [Marinobacter sp. SS13-12]MDK8465899.1 hypothetical protein [Marinobacter sp. SS13-12]